VIWREKRVLLIVLALLLAANTVFFFTYRVQFQQRLDSLEERRATAENQLEAARAARIRAEQQLASYRKIEVDVRRVYDEYWSTQSERLTPMILEVKRLADASGIVPSTISFSQLAIDAKTIVEQGGGAASATGAASRRKTPIGVSEVGISFSVNGTYEQARRLINLLELSNQFIIINQLALTSHDAGQLSLTLNVKTLFRDPNPPAAGATNPL
jgi:Tfp pilus assembly protein PilO